MLPQSVSEKIYFHLNKLRGMELRPLIENLKKTENLSASELEKYRLLKLKRQLEYVVNKIPFYQKWAKSVNFDINKIKSLRDLVFLPVVTKELLRSNIAEFLDDQVPFRSCVTSGSTGNPLEFFKDQKSLAVVKATGWQVYGWYGIKPGCKTASIWGTSRKPVGKIKKALENFLYNKIVLSAYEQNTKAYEIFYRKLLSNKPDFFYSYANSFFRFCKFIEDSNLSFDWKPKLVVVTGEMFFDWQKRVINRVFNNCRVANEYGSSEHGIIAFQCPYGTMHIMSQNLIVEILDAEGNPVEEGVEGEIVVTELASHSVPFIRYKIGDIGSISRKDCYCGLPYETLHKIKGRVDYLIHCPNGRIVDSSVLGLLADKVREFRGVQKATDKLEIQVVLDDNKPFDQEKIMEQLKSYLGSEMEVLIKPVQRLPLDPSGKFRYFIPLSEASQ